MFRVLVGKPEEKRRPRLGGRLILKRIFKKWNGVSWTGLIVEQGQVACSCEFGNGPSGSIK